MINDNLKTRSQIKVKETVTPIEDEQGNIAINVR